MILYLGFNYATEKSSELYIQGLIIDTENSTRYLDTKIHCFGKQKKSPFTNSNTTNILHKRQLHVTKQIHRRLVKVINNNKSK